MEVIESWFHWGLTGWYKEYPGHTANGRNSSSDEMSPTVIDKPWQNPLVSSTIFKGLYAEVFLTSSKDTKHTHISYLSCLEPQEIIKTHKRPRENQPSCLVKWRLLPRPRRVCRVSSWTTYSAVAGLGLTSPRSHPSSCASSPCVLCCHSDCPS